MNFVKATILAALLAGFASANPPEEVDGHFSSWSDVPAIIDSITGDDYREQMKQLHQLTRIKLGYPQASLCLSEKEHQAYMLHTKERWKQWWDSTGQPISKQKELEARVDQQAFRIAWDFLALVSSRQNQPCPCGFPRFGAYASPSQTATIRRESARCGSWTGKAPAPA